MLSEHKGEMIFIGIAMSLYLVMAAFDASQKFVYLAVLFGLFGLIIAWKIFESVDDEPAGNQTQLPNKQISATHQKRPSPDTSSWRCR
jgi:hypothetical protein